MPPPYSWTTENGWRYLWDHEKCLAGHPVGKNDPEDFQFWDGSKWHRAFKETRTVIDIKTAPSENGHGFVFSAIGDRKVMAFTTIEPIEVWLKVGRHWVKP